MVNITVDSAKCTGCKTCSDICPAGVFAMVEKAGGLVSVPKNLSACMECHACEYQCTVGAISFSDGPVKLAKPTAKKPSKATAKKSAKKSKKK